MAEELSSELLSSRSATARNPLLDAIGVLLLLFVVYTSATVPLDPTVHRSLFLLAIVVLALLLKPLPGLLRFVDVAVLVAAAISLGYLAINAEELAYRANFEPALHEYILGFAIGLVVLELTRRMVGLALSIVAVVAVLYARFGQWLPEPFTHKGYSVERLVTSQYLTHEGLFGSMLGVASTLVAAFILFGCALQHIGTADLFMRIASRVSRRGYGGPAKLAVVGSSLTGTMSGSSTANVVTTGTTTIPLMKRAGFTPTFAAATEAVASTGGQIMPPVMGVAAFLMAEITGIPYITIAIAAIVPAFLYYLSVFFEVDLEARRLGLRGGLDHAGTSLREILGSLHLLLPLVVLVWLLMGAYSATKAAFWASVVALVMGIPGWRRMLENAALRSVLRTFVHASVTVGLACATAGIVVGALNLTGAGLQLTYVLVELAGDNRAALLLFVMLVCVILGMGLPTPAAYAVAAAFAAPMLVTIGIGKLNAHLFILYFASLSSITPPVAIAAYAAAGLAGAKPMEVGWMACRIGAAAFIVPFMFVGNNALLVGQAATWELLVATITASIGVFALAVATIGHLGRPISLVERTGLLIVAILLIAPSLLWSAIGIALGAALIGYHALRHKKWV